MQPVSYNPCSLASHSSCITLATQEELVIAQLASPLAYLFISLKISPSLPFSPLSIVHCTMLCPTHPCISTCTHAYYPYRLIPSLAPNVLYRLALVFEIETLTETIFHAQRKERFVLGARGGHVACATEM
jgi:hypothetical protein